MIYSLFGLLTALLPIALVALIVMAIVRARRNNEDDDDEGAPGTVRRLFLYGVGLVALIFAGVGLSLLLGGFLDAVGGETVIEESDTELAVALSFTIVGLPAWLLVAVLAQRSLSRDRTIEVASEARRWYLNLARGIALVFVVVNGVAVARFIAGGEDFEGGPWGWLLVWGAIWALHDQVARIEEPSPWTRRIDHLYLAFGSVLGLAFLLFGAIAALDAAATAAYDDMFRSTLIRTDWSEDLRAALAVVVVGAAAWASHWVLRLQRRDRGSAARQVVLYLFGVLSGVALTLVPAAIALHLLLEWWFGTPRADTAAEHFASLPRIVSAAVVGLATWVYFRSVVADEPTVEDTTAPARGEPERVYRYLVSAAGLVVASAGVVTGLSLAIEAIVPAAAPLLRSDDWWRDRLVLTVTFLTVGVPVWAFYWASVQRSVARSAVERTVLSRRVYLFAIFGVAALVLLVNLTIVLFRLFDAALGDGLTREVIVDSRWSIALVLTAGIVAAYHWVVLREDQPATAATGDRPRRRPTRHVVVLTPGDDTTLATSVADLEGVRVHVWRQVPRRDVVTPPPPERVAALRAEIEASDDNSLVIVSERGELQVEQFTAADDEFPSPRAH